MRSNPLVVPADDEEFDPEDVLASLRSNDPCCSILNLQNHEDLECNCYPENHFQAVVAALHGNSSVEHINLYLSHRDIECIQNSDLEALANVMGSMQGIESLDVSCSRPVSEMNDFLKIMIKYKVSNLQSITIDCELDHHHYLIEDEFNEWGVQDIEFNKAKYLKQNDTFSDLLTQFLGQQSNLISWSYSNNDRVGVTRINPRLLYHGHLQSLHLMFTSKTPIDGKKSSMLKIISTCRKPFVGIKRLKLEGYNPYLPEMRDLVLRLPIMFPNLESFQLWRYSRIDSEFIEDVYRSLAQLPHLADFGIDWNDSNQHVEPMTIANMVPLNVTKLRVDLLFRPRKQIQAVARSLREIDRVSALTELTLIDSDPSHNNNYTCMIESFSSMLQLEQLELVDWDMCVPQQHALLRAVRQMPNLKQIELPMMVKSSIANAIHYQCLQREINHQQSLVTCQVALCPYMLAKLSQTNWFSVIYYLVRERHDALIPRSNSFD